MRRESDSEAQVKAIVVKPEMQIKTVARQDLDRIHEATLTIMAFVEVEPKKIRPFGLDLDRY